MPFDLDDLDVVTNAADMVPDRRRHPWLAFFSILAIIGLTALLIWL